MLGQRATCRIGRLLLLLAIATTLAVTRAPDSGAADRRHAPLMAGGGAAPDFMPGELLVALFPSAQGSLISADEQGRIRSAEARLSAMLARYGLDRFHPLEGQRPGAGRAPQYARLESTRPDFNPIAAANELRATGLFRAVCPNYRLSLQATIPNDTYLYLQWGVADPGDADVHLEEAWDLSKGDSSVVIGIIDTGVDLGQPDLESQIRINRGEIPGNGIDDDGNGFVDDVKGWDFGQGDNDPNPHPVIDSQGIDEGFHGTFVAGIASAATNNTTGIAGTGWRCRILPLKAVDTAGKFQLAAITGAFGYAIDNGASVLNMSFGGRDPGLPEYFQALVDDALSAGIVCVAAAGNDTSDVPSYPAACDSVIAVGATDENSQRTYFSNYGYWVDLSGPGQDIWSTICRNYTFDPTSAIIYQFFFGWDGVNPYMYASGTSMAAPVVSGICGLLHWYDLNKTPVQIRDLLVATADSVTGDSVVVGPKVNAFRALHNIVLAAQPVVHPGLLIEKASPNPFADATIIGFTLPEAGETSLSIFDASGRLIRTLVRGDRPAGRQSVRWDGRGDDGRRLAPGLYFAWLQRGQARASARLVALP